MRKFVTLLLSACFLLSPAATTSPVAQEPFVIVPDHPQGVPINGCYRATQQLFGPYQFNFCLTRPGTYTVRIKGQNSRTQSVTIEPKATATVKL